MRVRSEPRGAGFPAVIVLFGGSTDRGRHGAGVGGAGPARAVGSGAQVLTLPTETSGGALDRTGGVLTRTPVRWTGKPGPVAPRVGRGGEGPQVLLDHPVHDRVGGDARDLGSHGARAQRLPCRTSSAAAGRVDGQFRRVAPPLTVRLALVCALVSLARRSIVLGDAASPEACARL